MTQVDLGVKARDKVSGFEGVAVAFTTWLNGCIRYCLQPPVDKDGKLPEAQWFDEPQIERIGDDVVDTGPRDTGGPLPSIPARNPDPRR